MGIQVAVAGASGYAGGELLRLLAGHPDLEVAAVSAGSSAGKPITSVHPNLTGHPRYDGKNFDATDAATLAGAELIFMALPHGESAKLANEIPTAKIVDLSADFRLGDEDQWHQFYGADVAYAGRWAYGLPELPGAREQIEAARTVAAPGCYATTSILALAPLLHAGLAEPDDIVIVAASGTTGAGRSPRVDLLASEVMGSMSAYKVGGAHRHTPEIEQALTEVHNHHNLSSERSVAPPRPVTLSFTPTLAPMPRGILATATARLAPGDPRARFPRFRDENHARNLELLAALETIAAAREVTAAQLAIAWVASRGDDIIPLIGTKRRDRLDEALRALDLTLSTDELAAIEAAVPAEAVAGGRYETAQVAMLDSER